MSEDLINSIGDEKEIRITTKIFSNMDASAKKNTVALLLQKRYNLSQLTVLKSMNKVQIKATLPSGETIGYALIGNEYNISNDLVSLKNNLFNQEKGREETLKEIQLVFMDTTQDLKIIEGVNYMDLEKMLDEIEIFEGDIFRLL
ncbi:hypothetical protein [Flammeovirga kamogawensis]|nr:hypothetical protein [Flammeovirga kamogawensis]